MPGLRFISQVSQRFEGLHSSIQSLAGGRCQGGLQGFHGQSTCGAWVGKYVAWHGNAWVGKFVTAHDKVVIRVELRCDTGCCIACDSRTGQVFRSVGQNR